MAIEGDNFQQSIHKRPPPIYLQLVISHTFATVRLSQEREYFTTLRPCDIHPQLIVVFPRTARVEITLSYSVTTREWFCSFS